MTSATATPQNRIDLKHAVQIAEAYVLDLYPPGQCENLMLEEVERSDDGTWLITLGFDSRGRRTVYGGERAYKTCRIDPRTGEVLAMKIRPVE